MRNTAIAVLFLVLQLVLSNVALAVDPTLLLGYDGGSGVPGTNNNPHNLSKQSSNTIKAADTGDLNETRICVFCHTPHAATPQSTLWNRPDPDTMSTPQAFPLFDEARVIDASNNLGINDPAIVNTTQYKLDGVDGVEYPNGATKLCLSCHDGATAIGTLADGTIIAMTQNNITDPNKFWNPVASTGMDFSRTHPVSFVYTQAVVDYLNTPAVPGPGGGKADAYKLPDPASRIKLDSQQRMQCTVCHEPHVNTRGGGHTYPFWRNAWVGANDTEDYNLTCNECHTSVLTGTGHNI